MDAGELMPKMKRPYVKREPVAPGVITRKRAAELLGRTVRTIDLWIEKGILPVTRVNGSVFIREEDVLGLVPPPKTPRDAEGDA